jgi:hypothetical protein
MSQTESPDRTDELRDVFISVTGDDRVTERQDDDGTDRELPEDAEVDLDDGLDDALDGGETETAFEER